VVTKDLLGDLLSPNPAIYSSKFDTTRIRPLLDAVLDKQLDEVIWDKVYNALTESTPPPRPASSIRQTPWLRSTGSFANSTKHRKYVEEALKEELGQIYVGIPRFFEAFFGEVAGLGPAARAVFDKCKEGDSPLYREESGWQGWPAGAKEGDVLSWFARLTDQFLDFKKAHQPASGT
jgi:hypothetical protein